MRRAAAVRLLPALAALALALAPAPGLGPAARAQEAAGEPPAITLEVEDERPRIGQTVRLSVFAGGTPLRGARVAAVYRPNSSTTSTDSLAATDAAGDVFWTPTAAGPVNLHVWAPAAAEKAAPAVTFPVAVRYGGFPPSGLAIMLLAGGLLLGGAAFAMTMLLRAPPPRPGSQPPSS